MKKHFVAALFAAVATMALPAVASRNDGIVVDRADLVYSLNTLYGHIESLEEVNRYTKDPRQRRAIGRQVIGMRGEVDRLYGLIDNTRRRRHPDGRRRWRGRAMSPEDFNRFIAEVRRQGFSSSKIALVRDVAPTARFTTQQVIVVMKVMPFSSDKITTAAIMYPSVVDTHNWYQVYSHLPFDSDRKKLRKRIGSQRE